jgi:hypothetical protein
MPIRRSSTGRRRAAKAPTPEESGLTGEHLEEYKSFMNVRDDEFEELLLRAISAQDDFSSNIYELVDGADKKVDWVDIVDKQMRLCLLATAITDAIDNSDLAPGRVIKNEPKTIP